MFPQEPNGVEICIAGEHSLAKILAMHVAHTGTRVAHHVTLTVHYTTPSTSLLEDQLNANIAHNSNNININKCDEMSTPLDAFVRCDGLIALAECLPTLMPFIHEPLLNITDKDKASATSASSSSGHAADSSLPKTSPDFVDYVITNSQNQNSSSNNNNNESDEPFADDMYGEGMSGATATASLLHSTHSSSHKLKKMSMPPHAFIAFGLFLKIPGYAAVMLRKRRQAQCILKLLLGSRSSTRHHHHHYPHNHYQLHRVDEEEDFGLGLSTVPFAALKDLLADLSSNKQGYYYYYFFSLITER